MSEDKAPEGPVAEPFAKARSPLGGAPQTPGGGAKWAFIYLAVAVLLAAVSAYMHLVLKIRLMQPQVLFPALGAVWFGFRAAFAFKPKA